MLLLILCYILRVSVTVALAVPMKTMASMMSTVLRKYNYNGQLTPGFYALIRGNVITEKFILIYKLLIK